MMGRALPLWGGGLLIAAGVYQFTPLKLACLNKCRRPLAFLMSEWREGRLGTFVMGLRHGGYCLLCCWALMALLFVLGVMNLAWIALLAAFVLIEKLGCLDGGLGIPEMTVITCGQDEFDFRIGSIASVLTVGQPLPVYPRQRTSPRPVGMSQMCPQADMAQPRWV